MKKSLFLSLALMLSTALWALNVRDQFKDAASGLKFEITAVGKTNTVKVIENDYTGTTYTVPATVIYQSVTFAVTELGKGAFYKCKNITSLSLPSSIVKIGIFAMAYCDNLRTLDVAWTNKSQIPVGDNMGYNVFLGTPVTLRVPLCMVLTYLQVSKWNGLKIISQDPEIGYTFKVDNINYKVISVGENVQVCVDDNSQYEGTSLLIPQPVYYDDMPYTVTAIEANAFSGCSTLTQVTLRSFTPLSLGENAFSGTSLSAIYVPYKKGETYKSASGWSTYASMISDELCYIDAQGVQQTCPEEATIITDANYQVGWDTGWYVVQGNVTLSEGASCKGAVNLILADEATLTITTTDEEKAGIRVSETTSSLTIYGQVCQTGKLTATGGKYYGAGIGGRRNYAGRNITINGGIVTAQGGAYAAGIGGGEEKNGENITINAGHVTAIGGDNASCTCIGSGWYSGYSSSNIFISENCVVRSGTSFPLIYLIEHTSSTDLTNKFIGHIATIKSTFPFTYGDNITTTANLASGDRIEVGEIVSFTAADRTAEGLAFVGFYSDEECLHSLTSREGSMDYTIRVPFAPVSVYAKYIEAVSITYGEYISVSPEYASGDRVIKGTQLTFTAADRSEEHLNFEGFYSDEACQNRITTGVSGLTYTVTAAKKPISVYAKYEIKQVVVTYGDYITVEPSIASGSKANYGTQLTFTAADRSEEHLDLEGFYSDEACQDRITTGVSGMTYTMTAAEDPISVYAKYKLLPIPYIDENGEEQQCLQATIITSSDNLEVWEEGWYVVLDADVQLAQGVVCQGDVHLILADGTKLTTTGVSHPSYSAGINVSGEGNSLSIYGQTAQNGQLVAKGGTWGAGIGGNKGQDGSHINIYGGMVTASGGDLSAGIGGGSQGGASHITINGGTVQAIAGVGTSEGNKAVAAIGIGDGSETLASDIYIAEDYIVTADGETIPVPSSSTDMANSLAGKKNVYIQNSSSVFYIDQNGNDQLCYNPIVISSSESSVTWNAGWYVVNSDVTLSNGAVCSGDVHLILADGAHLTTTGYNGRAGINVFNGLSHLTIYGQTEQTGQLTAQGGAQGAGVGKSYPAGSFNNACSITINGGVVEALGGNGAAGIGGSFHGDGYNITINRGKVTAIGGKNAAGIGGGNEGSGSNITIKGGTVTATGGENGAGIGNGDLCSTPAQDIFVADNLAVRAGTTNPPTEEIAHSAITNDISDLLAAKRYVVIRKKEGFSDLDNPTLPYEGKVGKGSFKVIENGHFMIIRDGKRYTMMGVEE